MEKNYFLSSKAYTLLFLAFSLLTYQSSYSQCTNPEPIGDSAQSFCKTDNSTVFNLVATGGAIVWFDAPTGGTIYNDSEPLFDGVIYYADDVDAGGCSTSRLAVTVAIYGDVPADTDVFVGKCASENPTIADLSATGVNIEWYDAQTGGNLLLSTELLTDGFTYWVQQTENGCTSDRLPTTVTVINPTSPTVEPIQSFCAPPNPTISDLQATGTNIIWYDTEISSTPLNSAALLINGEDYWAVDSAFPCESTDRVQTTVVLDTAPDAGTNGSYAVCEVDLVATNLFDLLGGTPDTTGTWAGPSTLTGGYLGTFEPSTHLEGTYTYTVSTALGICADETSEVLVDITEIAPPTITETTQSFCLNDFLPDAPTVADLIPTTDIIWYNSEISTTAYNSTDVLDAVNEYWAAQFDTASGCESAIRIQVTVVLDTALDAGTNGSYAVCEVDVVTTNLFDLLGGTPDTTGTWTGPSTLTGGYLGTFEPSTHLEGTYTYTVSTALGICADETSEVLVNITEIAPPTITETTQSFCLNDFLPDAPTVADLIPTTDIIWYNSEISTTAYNSTDVLDAVNEYWAAQFDTASGCESAIRIQVTVVLDTALDAGTNGSYAVCEVDVVTTNLFDLLGGTPDTTGTWTGPSTLTGGYLGTFEPSTHLEGTYTYTVSTALGICADETSEVLVDITEIDPPTTTETTQSFCLNDFLPDTPTIADLNISGVSILWYDTESSSTPLNSTDNLIDGEDYWATQTDATTTCESATRTQVNVVLISPQLPGDLQTTQTFCLANHPTIGDLEPTDSGILWFNSETSDTPLATSTSLSDSGQYWAAQTDATTGCESIARIMVTTFINDVVEATIANASQTFCASDLPTIAALDVTGTAIVWYISETDTTPLDSTTLLVDGQDYWAVQTDGASGCQSSDRVTVNVTLTDPGTPSISTLGNEFCIIDNPTIGDLNTNVSAVNGGTITWYDAYPNGLELSLSEFLTEGETYYAVETDADGCASFNPLTVTVTLDSCDQYDIDLYDGFSPSGNGINDTFSVGKLRILYPNFSVEFFNRWGNLVYTANASKPDWNGRLNGDGELVPAGVYYYIIYFNKNDRKPVQRRLYLSR